ncbi:MAG: hypothetical protein IIA62_09655 [Nitrospinae bacterium]|nr:hypothetical protein [Nitrospinota bacterium]
MAVSAALGLFPGWIKEHVGYFPSVFVIFSIAYSDKLLPALSRLRNNLFSEWKILAVSALIVFCFIKFLPRNIDAVKYFDGTQQSMIIKAGKAFAEHYGGGMIMIDLPSFIYGTDLPVDKFISSNNIPDDPSRWGEYLEANNVRYLVWTSADYASISYFSEDLIKNNESGVKFEHIYSIDPNPMRKCHIYKVVDYGA